MIDTFIELVGGTVLIALLIAIIAAIFIGLAIGFLMFVIGPILILIGYICGWDKQDKKEAPAEENI